MSHDQKPGKVRVVGNAVAAPERRRGEAAADPAAVVAASTVAGSPSAGDTAPAKSGKSAVLLAILFIVGCAIGGAALPLLGLA